MDVLKASYQPSRLHSFWLNVLSRELMLKLNIEHVGQLPKLEHVEVSIHARDVLKAANVEKWQVGNCWGMIECSQVARCSARIARGYVHLYGWLAMAAAVVVAAASKSCTAMQAFVKIPPILAAPSP